MEARFGLSLEQAKSFSGIAESCLSDPLPADIPFDVASASLGLNLLPHQRFGVEWMMKLYYNGLGGVLADEMGLGKTVQVASLFSTLQHLRCFGTHLVVAPLVTLDNWEREIKKWCPLISVMVYHGSATERDSKRRWLQKRQRAVLDSSLLGSIADTSKPISDISREIGSVIITSFEMVLTPNCPLGSVSFDTLIVDEAHRLKNTDCKLIRTLRRFKADTRILLTGTPLQNNILELWSIINFVMPFMFTSSDEFEEWVNAEVRSEEGSGEGGVSVSSRASRRMHQILRPFVLRRSKADIDMLALPPKYQVILEVSLSDKEKAFYNKIRFGDSDGVGVRLNNKLMHLRKACCHPFTFEDQNPFRNQHQATQLGEWDRSDRESYLKALLAEGTKLRVLHTMLRQLRNDGHRVLVFSQFTTVLDIIENSLFLYNSDLEDGALELTNCRLDGSNSREERGDIVAAFSATNAVDPPFCFLISTRSGGVGINLTAADTVILYDCDFNPQNDFQAIDRCHRIGQTRPVVVYRIVCLQTVEEAMLHRALGKVQLDRALFTGGNFSRMMDATGDSTEGSVRAESGRIPGEEEVVHRMTMAYNFGESRQHMSEADLLKLLNRKHVCDTYGSSIPNKKRVRIES